MTESLPTTPRVRPFKVYWGYRGKNTPQGAMGAYIIDAPHERGARKEAKRHLDALFLGSTGYRILYVMDVEANQAAIDALTADQAQPASEAA